MNWVVYLSYIIWDVNPEIFPSVPFLRWYGLLWALGILCSYQIMYYIYRKEGKEMKEVDTLAIYIIIGAILGARLGHIVFYDPLYYLQHPEEILPIQLEPEFQFTGLQGLASHGGAMGILLGLWLYRRKYKANYLWILDRLVVVAALCGSFIRLGNLMNSEIIGIPAQVAWAFVFIQVDHIPRHPAQLYESIGCMVLFIILFVLWQKRKFFDKPGFTFGVFLVLLFSFRFVVEFFKINQEPFEESLPINMGQILSIPFIFIGLFMMILSQYRVMGQSDHQKVK